MESYFFFKAPPSLFLNGLSVINILLSAICGFGELKGNNMPYSKFFNNITKKNSKNEKKPILVPSKSGMLICYSPAFLASLVSFFFLVLHQTNHSTVRLRILFITSALTLHFFKRVFEVLFVHKYSGNMEVGTAIVISMGYLSSTSSMVYAQYLSQGLQEPQIDLKYFGVLLFLIGINGNFYHHYLLAQLRDKKSTSFLKEYKIPKGGVFNLVICPHYLFEIILFVGLSFISQTLHSFSIAIGTMMYLVGRSCATLHWYHSKFEDFPQGVKALIPYLL